MGCHLVPLISSLFFYLFGPVAQVKLSTIVKKKHLTDSFYRERQQ